MEAFSVNMRTWFSSSTILCWAASSDNSDRRGTAVPHSGQEEDAVVESWGGGWKPGAAVAMSVVVVDMDAGAMNGSAWPHFPATLGRGDPDAAWCGC